MTSIYAIFIRNISHICANLIIPNNKPQLNLKYVCFLLQIYRLVLLLSFINEIFLVVIVSNKHMNKPGKPRVLQALSFIVMHVFFKMIWMLNKYILVLPMYSLSIGHMNWTYYRHNKTNLKNRYYMTCCDL